MSSVVSGYITPNVLCSITLACIKVDHRKFAFGLFTWHIPHNGPYSCLMNTESLHMTPFKVEMKDSDKIFMKQVPYHKFILQFSVLKLFLIP